jgi:hypothetical protein
MSRVVSTVFPTLESAELAVQELVRRGIPEGAILLEEQSDPMAVSDVPAHGLSLGAGVTPEVTEAIVEQHDGEGPTFPVSGGYTVSVDAAGDQLNEELAREVLASSSAQ